MCARPTELHGRVGILTESSPDLTFQTTLGPMPPYEEWYVQHLRQGSFFLSATIFFIQLSLLVYFFHREWCCNKWGKCPEEHTGVCWSTSSVLTPIAATLPLLSTLVLGLHHLVSVLIQPILLPVGSSSPWMVPWWLPCVPSHRLYMTYKDLTKQD